MSNWRAVSYLDFKEEKRRRIIEEANRMAGRRCPACSGSGLCGCGDGLVIKGAEVQICTKCGGRMVCGRCKGSGMA